MIKRTLLILTIVSTMQLMHAQTGRVGINTSAPRALLHVNDSSVVFTGPAVLPETAGPVPVNGTGTRMMWYADRAAFRTGRALNDIWHQIFVGEYSFAAGNAPLASGLGSVALGASWAQGDYSVALGNTNAQGLNSFSAGATNFTNGQYALTLGRDNKAPGDYSMAMGRLTHAQGDSAIALGYRNLASGTAAVAIGSLDTAVGNHSLSMGHHSIALAANSVAIGTDVKAAGNHATATGFNTQANGFSSLVVGQYNDPIVSPQSAITSTTPLFIVGNGNDANTRSNALVVRKDGNIGVGTSNPLSRLHVWSGASGASPAIGTNAIVESNSNATINLLTPGNKFSGIYFGNVTNPAHGAIVYNDEVANGLGFRTNGNNTRMVITNAGAVGIGTTAPGRNLEVSGSGYQAIRVTSSNDGKAAIELESTGAVADWRLIDSMGTFYIGRSTDDFGTVTEVLRVAAGEFTPAVDNAITLGNNNFRWLSVHAVNGTIQTSDARDKESIQSLQYGLSDVLKLNPVSFLWKDPDIDNHKTHLGFVAQELMRAIPEVVVTHAWNDPADGTPRSWEEVNRLGVNYAELIPVLTKAIQEQQVLIEDLERELAILERLQAAAPITFSQK